MNKNCQHQDNQDVLDNQDEYKIVSIMMAKIFWISQDIAFYLEYLVNPEYPD